MDNDLHRAIRELTEKESHNRDLEKRLAECKENINNVRNSKENLKRVFAPYFISTGRAPVRILSLNISTSPSKPIVKRKVLLEFSRPNIPDQYRVKITCGRKEVSFEHFDTDYQIQLNLVPENEGEYIIKFLNLRSEGVLATGKFNVYPIPIFPVRLEKTTHILDENFKQIRDFLATIPEIRLVNSGGVKVTVTSAITERIELYFDKPPDPQNEIPLVFQRVAPGVNPNKIQDIWGNLILLLSIGFTSRPILEFQPEMKNKLLESVEFLFGKLNQ